MLLWGGVQTRIVGARKGDDLYLIPAEGDPLPPPGTAVRGAIEDDRRTALMRTHSGLHVLCGVVFRDYGSLVTGGNMEPFSARMDFDLPQLPDGFRDAVRGGLQRRDRGRPPDRRAGAAARRRLRDPRHHPHRDEPGPARGQGSQDRRHRRPRPAGRRRHPRRVDRQIGRIEVVKIENKGKGFRRLRIRIAD